MKTILNKTNNISGKWLILFSTISFSFSGLFTKLASSSMSFLETVFFRAFFGIIILLIASKFVKPNFKTQHKKNLILRGVFGTLSLLCIFYAIKYSSLTKGIMLMYTYPIYATLFSRFFYGEKLPRIYWLLLTIAFSGILLIVNPNVSNFNFADFVGFIGGILAGAAITLVRELRKTDNPQSIYLWFLSIALLITAPFAIPLIKIHPLKIWIFALNIGLFTTIGQLIMAKAYQTVSTGIGSAISLQGITITTLLGYMVGEVITLNAVIGGLIIIITGISVGNLPIEE